MTHLSKLKKQQLIDRLLESAAPRTEDRTAPAAKETQTARPDKGTEKVKRDRKPSREQKAKGAFTPKTREHGLKEKNGRESREKNHGASGNYSGGRYAKIKDNIQDTVEIEGPVEVMPEGFGFIRRGDDLPIYVSGSQIQKFKLVTGDVIGGKVRSPKPGEKYAAMLFLEIVNGTATTEIISRMNSLMHTEDTNDKNRYKETQCGILDINPEGFGFLRTNNYLSGEKDIYIAANQIRRYNLRTGDKIEGKIRMSGEGEKFDALLYVERVNGDLPETVTHRPKFERLTPIFPEERITLETEPDIIATRLIDLFAPVGLGQRGMIVAAPKAGKTTLLKNIALGIRTNHPSIELIILLVDERPEEVTDMKRSVDADIVYSTFDQPPENHIRVAEMVLARSKRLVEQGKDVVVLIDSLTRLTRGNNLVIDPSGRTLSGGLDPESLYFPKKFFGSARNIEHGGSLTILATALIDTGSRMDDIIYEEFKGTGNMELHLDRELSERRIFPAIDLHKSGTRREDKLLTPEELKVSYSIRKNYASASAMQLTDKIINILERTDSNRDFLGKFVSRQKS
jgi:transcription termination factor Rho